MLHEEGSMFISFRTINDGESMIDKYGEMIKIDHNFYSPVLNNRDAYKYGRNLIEGSEKNYLFKSTFDKKYDEIEIPKIKEELTEKLSNISLLNENKADLHEAEEVLLDVVLPNTFGIIRLLGDSSIEFTTYIFKPSLVEVYNNGNKTKTPIFKVMNLYQNGFIETFDFYNNKTMRINEYFEIAHINTQLYTFDVRSSKYIGQNITILDESTFRTHQIYQVHNLLPTDLKLDLTEHNFLVDRFLSDNKQRKSKEEILNVVSRPINLIEKVTIKKDDTSIKNYKSIYFYGNKNHSFIYADKNIKNSYSDDITEREYTNNLFLNVYPSLFDSLIDIHIYQKLRNMYDLEEKVDKNLLMNKKQQIYSLKKLKERAYNPTRLTITEFSSELRESLIPQDFEKKLNSHYHEMDVTISEIQQNEIVNGQNKLQLILLVISTIALIVSISNLDIIIEYKLASSCILILIAIVLYNDKNLL